MERYRSAMLAGLAASVAALSIVFASGSAAAEPVIAKLKTPLPGAEKPVAGGAVFECLGDVCAARAPGADTAGTRGCKELARQVGAVATYGPSSKPLAPDQLAACNESARK
jgi:hypothetical protein